MEPKSTSAVSGPAGPDASGQVAREDESTTALKHFNHHQTASVADLYDAYAAAGMCPVSHSEELGGFWMITGYDEVRAAARDWQLFSSAKGMFLPRIDLRFPPIDMDPPEATQWRDLVRDELSASGVRELEPALRAACVALVDEVIESGSCDLVAVLCEPLPVLAICRLLGVEGERAPELRPVARKGLEGPDPSPVNAGFVAFLDWVRPQIEARREQPRDDLLTRLTTATVDGQPLSDEALLLFLIGLLSAGHDTTTSAMASTFLHICGDPHVRDALREDHRLVRTATEEAIRLHSPLHMFFRQTTADTTVGDTAIPADCPVGLNYAAANRDTSVFPGSDEFRLDRSPNPHVGFGFGPHACVGASLARLEIQIAVETVLDRMPDIELAADADSLQHTFIGGNLVQMEHVPVRFTPGQRMQLEDVALEESR